MCERGLWPRECVQSDSGFSATEGADVGLNTGTLTEDYEVPFVSNGKIAKVTIDLKDDKESAADQDAIVKTVSDADLKRRISD